MSAKFTKIDPEKLDFNVFDEVGKRKLLITAYDGEKGRANPMTASWGTMGILWNKPVCTLFIRPQRHTKPLVDACGVFSVNVLRKGYEDVYRVCGTVSGRDEDKVARCALTPFEVDGAYGFEESETVLIVKKLYAEYLKEGCFTDKSPLVNYGSGDFHMMYVCEIVAAYTSKN